MKKDHDGEVAVRLFAPQARCWARGRQKFSAFQLCEGGWPTKLGTVQEVHVLKHFFFLSFTIEHTSQLNETRKYYSTKVV